MSAANAVDGARTVCFVSDRTGVTAETVGHSLLSLFGGMSFRTVTMPFVLNPEQASGVVARINALGAELRAALADGRLVIEPTVG